MDKKTVNILGTEYTIEKKEYKDEPAFEKRGIDGYCDGRLRKIVHCDMVTHPIMKEEPKEYCKVCEKQTLRHEIIHGFFNESGLMESSAQYTGGWSQNEEMVRNPIPEDFQGVSGIGYFVGGMAWTIQDTKQFTNADYAEKNLKIAQREKILHKQ